MKARPEANATPFEVAAPVLRRLGYQPIPCIGKRPAVEHWRTGFDGDPEAFKGFNTGIVLGGFGNLVALDLDVDDEALSRDLQVTAQANLTTGLGPVRIGRAPRALILFRTERLITKRRHQFTGPIKGAFEFLSEGQQFVAYGTHPDTGTAYRWPNEGPLEVDFSDLPVISLERLNAMEEALINTVVSYRCWIASNTKTTSTGANTKTADSANDWAVEACFEFPPEAHGVIGCLARLDPNDRETWVNVGQALKSEEIRTREAWPVDLWCSWSALSPKWKGFEVEGKVWESFKRPRASLDNIAHWLGERGFANEFDVDDGSSALPEVAPAGSPKPKSLAELNAERQRQQREAEASSAWRLNPLDFASLEDRDIPEASFCLPGILPDNVVTLFSAHGGTGKSYIALMVAVAVATGNQALNRSTKPRRVLYYSCEEPEGVLLLRLKRICRYFGVDSNALLASGMLVIHNGFGESNVMFSGSREVEQRLTSTYRGLLRYVKSETPGLVILDNSSEIYDASEIDRALVRQFIQSLNRFAKITHGAVMLIAHVDKATTTGASVTGYSGSTAWHNSVRSRWFLHDKGSGLVLAFQKSNYSELAEDLRLEWKNEDKVFEVTGVIERKKEVVVNEDEAVLKVIAALAHYAGEGVVVPDTSTSTHNGVSLIAQHSGLDRKVVKETLVRMHARKLVERVDYRKTNRMGGTALQLTEEGRLLAVVRDDDDFLN